MYLQTHSLVSAGPLTYLSLFSCQAEMAGIFLFRSDWCQRSPAAEMSSFTAIRLEIWPQ